MKGKAQENIEGAKSPGEKADEAAKAKADAAAKAKATDAQDG